MNGEKVQVTVGDEDQFFTGGELLKKSMQDVIKVEDFGEGFQTLGEAILPLGFVGLVVSKVGVSPVDEVFDIFW